MIKKLDCFLYGVLGIYAILIIIGVITHNPVINITIIGMLMGFCIGGMIFLWNKIIRKKIY